MRFLVVLALLPLLAGCLPSAGPGRSAIVSRAERAVPEFTVIELDQTIAEILASHSAESLAATFGMGDGAPNLTIGVGDQVIVTIFEAASGGLFSGDPGALGGTKSVNLPAQPVARDGTLSMPYVGRVRAAGLTPDQVGRAIEAALQEKAIEPQVVVTVARSDSTFVTVAGDVARPTRVPLTLKGDRLLDIVATVGGSRAPDYDSFVRLTRGGRSATVSLARIVRDPGQNIYVRPDDLIYVYIDPQMFTAFGATARNASFPFQTDRLPLAEAVGRAGGLLDTRADPHGVFVFRYEDPDMYRLIRTLPSDAGGRAPPPEAAGIPVVYKLDLKDPVGLFAAQRFLMQDNDILYVSNAAAADLQKAIAIVSGGIGTARAIESLRTDLQDE
jgi:polysaccharide export outer membrane protein